MSNVGLLIYAGVIVLGVVVVAKIYPIMKVKVQKLWSKIFYG